MEGYKPKLVIATSKRPKVESIEGWRRLWRRLEPINNANTTMEEHKNGK